MTHDTSKEVRAVRTCRVEACAAAADAQRMIQHHLTSILWPVGLDRERLSLATIYNTVISETKKTPRYECALNCQVDINKTSLNWNSFMYTI